MLYTLKSFTCPAAPSTRVSQRQWDYAIMGKDAFLTKYGADSSEYVETVAVEFHTDQVPAVLPPHSGSVLVVTSGTDN